MAKLKAADRPKRPDSAKLARSRKVVITHGGSGQRILLRGQFDKRSRVYHLYQERVAEFTAHLGSEPTVTQARIIDQAARLNLLVATTWDAVHTTGVLVDGAPSGALEAYLRCTKEERATMLLLGLERGSKRVPSLSELIAEGRQGELLEEPPEEPKE